MLDKIKRNFGFGFKILKSIFNLDSIDLTSKKIHKGVNYEFYRNCAKQAILPKL